MLKPIRSYTGRIGCMCGCLGKYNEEPTKLYKDLIRVLKHPNCKWDADNKCYYYMTETRNNVVYMGEKDD